MKTTFWRKLDTLLRSRLPLLEALELLKRESREPQEKIAVEGILKKLRAGAAFSEAVEGAGIKSLSFKNNFIQNLLQNNFSPKDSLKNKDSRNKTENLSKGALRDTRIASVHGILLAGERAGNLTAAIRQIAERLETRERLRAQVIGASVYPALVLLLCVGLCVILSLVVLPKFQKLFAALGVNGALPPLTQAVMGFGIFLKTSGLWLLIGVVAIVAGLRLWLKREQWNAFLWRLPLLGELWKISARENFLGTLGLLLKSGAPLDEALGVTGQALAQTPLEKVAQNACERTKQGDRLSAVLRGSRAFEESQVELLALSETGGNLGESCEHLASLLQERLQTQLKTVFSILEPSLVVLMAGVVAVLVVALFLPLGPLVARLAEGG